MISQNDPRWKDLPINNTAYKMGGYGCFVSCVSYVAGIEPPEALKKLTFDGAMLNWESIVNVGLVPLEKVNVYDNDKVKAYISANGQCIVRVDWDGQPLTDKDTHFVVYIGNGKLLDPIDGKEKPTSTYPLVTGIRACKKVTMASDLEACMADRQKFWNERDAILSEIPATDLTNAKSVLGGMRGRITDLSNQIGTLQGQQTSFTDQISTLTNEVANKDSQINNLTDQLNTAKANLTQALTDKQSLVTQLATLQVQYDTLKQQGLQGSITLTWGEVFQLLLKQKVTITK